MVFFAEPVKMASVETLIETSCSTIGEGPHWDERTGQFLYVDINDFSVHRWTAATGKSEKHKFGKTTSVAENVKYSLISE